MTACCSPESESRVTDCWQHTRFDSMSSGLLTRLDDMNRTLEELERSVAELQAQGPSQKTGAATGVLPSRR